MVKIKQCAHFETLIFAWRIESKIDYKDDFEMTNNIRAQQTIKKDFCPGLLHNKTI